MSRFYDPNRQYDEATGMTEITRLRAELATKETELNGYHAILAERDAEITQLKHDIARHLAIISEQEAEIARYKSALTTQNETISQTLGKALGFPWFKDDPKNFPDATERDGVCVGELVAEDLAAIAAKRLAKYEAEIARLRAERRTIIAAFRVNMMRQPGYSHAEFDRRIAEILAHPIPSPPETEK